MELWRVVSIEAGASPRAKGLLLFGWLEAVWKKEGGPEISVEPTEQLKPRQTQRGLAGGLATFAAHSEA